VSPSTDIKTQRILPPLEAPLTTHRHVDTVKRIYTAATTPITATWFDIGNFAIHRLDLNIDIEFHLPNTAACGDGVTVMCRAFPD
jgi:hypothetical protein